MYQDKMSLTAEQQQLSACKKDNATGTELARRIHGCTSNFSIKKHNYLKKDI
jgi:hypothetical protein